MEINTWEAPGALEYRALDISPEVPEGFAANATVCSHLVSTGMWEFCQEWADTTFFGDVESGQLSSKHDQFMLLIPTCSIPSWSGKDDAKGVIPTQEQQLQEYWSHSPPPIHPTEPGPALSYFLGNFVFPKPLSGQFSFCSGYRS